MGRPRTASASQYVGKPNHLRCTRARGAVCRQDQRCDGARRSIVLLGPPRPCAGLCHRDSMASHWLVGRFVRGVVANPLPTSVGIEAPSGVRSGLKGTILDCSAIADVRRCRASRWQIVTEETSIAIAGDGLLRTAAPSRLGTRRQKIECVRDRVSDLHRSLDTRRLCSHYVLTCEKNLVEKSGENGRDGNDSHHPPCGPGCLLCLRGATA